MAIDYRQHLNASMRQQYDVALKDLDVESGDVFYQDMALIDARIANLLKAARRSPSFADIKKLHVQMSQLITAFDEYKIETYEAKKVSFPDEVNRMTGLIYGVQGIINSMVRSDEAWKTITELQKQKREYVESQRMHNTRQDTTRMTKTQFNNEITRLYNVLVNNIEDVHLLNRIATEMGMSGEKKQLPSANTTE